MPSLLRHFECPGCHRTWSPREPATYCTGCERTLRSVYDLAAARDRLSLASLRARGPSLWRFQELLPILDPGNQVTLGEGETPILPVGEPRYAPGLTLLVKDDGLLPTGSFKARGMAVAVSRARELGIGTVMVPSAGNAGAALAAYARRASITARIYMPRDAPRSARDQVTAYGGTLRLVEGHIGDAGRIAREEAKGSGAFDISTLREPGRAEGKKTMGLEIAVALGPGSLPDAIVYPTGGGTGLLGMHHAFQELTEMGWIEKVPRLYAAQSSGCAPVVEALRKGRSRVEPVAHPETIAAGLRVPNPFSSEDILQAVRSTGGGGVAVPDPAILEATRWMASRHGISICREAGCALAGIRLLREEGTLDAGERVLLYNTGTGLVEG